MSKSPVTHISSVRFPGNARCLVAQGRRPATHRTHAPVTTDAEKVTCQRCLAALATDARIAAQKAARQG